MKSALETSVTMLKPLFLKICQEQSIPQEWKEGFIVKLPKNGDLSQCKNYRGIMLLSTQGKVFNRMKTSVDKLLMGQLAGFRKDRSCPDHIATLRLTIEQSLEWKTPLYVKTSVDKLLIDQQACFRKDRSCPDHIATLRITIEQSLEWKTPLYVNFINFEKALCGQNIIVEDYEALWNPRQTLALETTAA
ncbi:uncharacterized protein LOC124259653 [Haliotis rubra]|uniref:uncharacterized protein LOC124259653 n=1 Tax=Haliotis rubra TaxID=36100 RepID=UPI001EE55B87|nr:uncharacterized protein LOC124259653 [Haliotis rubra]